MKRKVLATGLLSIAAVLALATQPMADGHSPVEQREAAMGTIGKNIGMIGKMLKGETDFDAATANASLVAMRDAIEGFEDLYPDGTQGETSNKYLASDKVFTDRDGFAAEVTKMEDALDAAIAANAQDQASLGAVFGPVGGSCKSCHEGYRAQQ